MAIAMHRVTTALRAGGKTLFGKKSTTNIQALAQRVRKVAETASFVPEDPAVVSANPFGRRFG